MTFDKSGRFLPLLWALAILCLASAAQAQGQENVLKGKLMYSTHTVVLAPFTGKLVEFEHACGQKVEKGQTLGWVELPESDWRDMKHHLLMMKETIVNQPGRRKLELQKEQLIQQRNAEQELIDKGFSAQDAVADIDVEVEMVTVALNEFDQDIKMQKADYVFELNQLNEKFKHKVNPVKLPRRAPVVAEAGGYVVTVYSREQKGEMVRDITRLMTISEVDPMIVQAQVFERDVVGLSVGDKAKIRVDALGGEEYEATLTKISWTPLQQSLNVPSYYEIELEVENPELRMKEGFEVQVVFNK